MLLLMIAVVVPFLPDWMFKPMQENDYSDVKPLVSNCRIIKDISKSFFKNDKYRCN